WIRNPARGTPEQSESRDLPEPVIEGDAGIGGHVLRAQIDYAARYIGKLHPASRRRDDDFLRGRRGIEGQGQIRLAGWRGPILAGRGEPRRAGAHGAGRIRYGWKGKMPVRVRLYQSRKVSRSQLHRGARNCRARGIAHRSGHAHRRLGGGPGRGQQQSRRHQAANPSIPIASRYIHGFPRGTKLGVPTTCPTRVHNSPTLTKPVKTTVVSVPVQNDSPPP